MAVRFYTDSPAALLKEFDAKVLQKEREGSITTWTKTKLGNYTHTSRWGNKAYLRPNANFEDRLVFNVVPPKGGAVGPEDYSFYHGHLIETFLNHFPEKFTTGVATAKPTKQDKLVSDTA